MPIHSDSSNLSTYNHRLFADQVQKQYEHTIFGTAATLINGIILVFVLRTHVQQLNLIIWLTVACTISASRLILHWRYDRSTNQKSHPERWNVYFNVTLFLSGLLWGSTAIFLFPSESTGHQAFVALITGGMVAGAVGAFTAVFESFFLFSIPAVLPIGIRFFLIGGEIHVAMGLMVLLFLLIISLTAARMHADIFSLLSLKYERSTLIADLQQEVHRRKAAQEDLRKQKEAVEEIVSTRTAQLEHANQRLRAILNYAPLVIWAVNRQGRLTFVDGKGAQKIGLAVETSEGESIFDLYAEDGPIVDITQRVLTGEFIAGTIQFKDGFFEVRYQPMADADSRLTGAIGVAIDVTEQTTAKAALRQSQENYRELVENINDVIYVIDNEGIITYVSPVIQSVLGYRVDELIGENFFNFIHHQDQKRVEQDYASALEVVGNQREYRFLDKSGEIKWCRVSSRPIPEGHKKLGIQGVLVDVTRSKRLEEQLQRAQKMEALGTMAGGVAHDLNNILSGIVSYPELLLMDLPRNSPLHQPLTTIKKSGENAAAIVQDLLTLARRGVSARELLDLNQIVEQCLDSPEIQGLLNRQTTIRLSTRLQSDLLYIYGSAHHLSKSVSNLIFNAVEAMPEGGRVEITTANRHADRVVSGFDTVKAGDYVVVSIVDSGIGIPERDQSRIFEPFYTKKVMGQSGSGLGMAVVWGTVKDHDGFIDLQSAEGQGTQFELFFPATRDQPKQSRKDEALSDYAGRGELILVVDDMATQREIATRILKRLGYRTKSAASGEEAIEFFRQHSADLVIIDMIMDPGIDGYDTYRHIIDIYPEQKAIIASGFSETERVRKTIALGAGRYIRKPYSMGALAKALKAELER